MWQKSAIYLKYGNWQTDNFETWAVKAHAHLWQVRVCMCVLFCNWLLASDSDADTYTPQYITSTLAIVLQAQISCNSWFWSEQQSKIKLKFYIYLQKQNRSSRGIWSVVCVCLFVCMYVRATHALAQTGLLLLQFYILFYFNFL